LFELNIIIIMSNSDRYERQDSLALEIEQDDQAAEQAEEARQRPSRARARLQELANRPSSVGAFARQLNPLLPPDMRIHPSRYDHAASAPPVSRRVEVALVGAAVLDGEDELLGDVELLEDDDDGHAAAQALVDQAQHNEPPSIPPSGYLSPFVAAWDDVEGVMQYRYARMASCDIALENFLRDITSKAADQDLLLVSTDAIRY
jgi:hypothetical protein